MSSRFTFQVRVDPKHKSSHLHFPNLFEIQTLGNVGHNGGGGGGGGGIGNGGPIWAMKFSHCGRLLATGGQDNVLRIWVLRESYPYFDEMKQKFSADNRQSPSPSHDRYLLGSSDEFEQDISSRLTVWNVCTSERKEVEFPPVKQIKKRVIINLLRIFILPC